MPERTPVYFNAWGRNDTQILAGSILKYDEIEFNVGGGVYDQTNYQYQVKTAGTYLIGYSYMKKTTNSNARVALTINRNSQLITLELTNHTQAYANLSRYGVTISKLEVDDLLYVRSIVGSPRVNDVAYTDTNVIKNSFWAIRLDYDYK